MKIYLLSCFLVPKILNNDCYYEEVMLKKSYFHGDTIGFAQQTLRYVQPQFLYFHKCFEKVHLVQIAP